MEIQGFPNYLIHEDGLIWSKARNNREGRWLKCSVHGDGYFQIVLRNESKRKGFKIHRLIAEHYLPNPNNLPCIDHKDGIRTHNSLSNLKWVTRLENSQNLHNRKGVRQDKDGRKKCWRATWSINGKGKTKCFETEEEAVNYREQMVKKYYYRPENCNPVEGKKWKPTEVKHYETKGYSYDKKYLVKPWVARWQKDKKQHKKWFKTEQEAKEYSALMRSLNNNV